jgi:phage FluMu gp28-like protein
VSALAVMPPAKVKRPRKVKVAAAPSPLSILLPYQAKWVRDDARFKIGMWARQTGKSFATAAEAVRDCLQRKTTWVVLSAGERQALEWMRKAREWASAFKVALGDYQEHRDSAEALLKTAEISWPNGSRIVGLPANPDTARGYSANLALDEFAFHERPDDIWRAIYPSISNPLKGQFKLRIVSTPNGTGNKFHDLWVKDNGWSKHQINIHDAVAGGLKLNVDELRKGLDDADGWAQEYECQFIDSAAVLLPYELIATCESAEAGVFAPQEFFQTTGKALNLGIDFGRKKDLTVCWTMEQLGDVQHTREVLELRKTDTPSQVEILRPRLQAARRVCVDYTGPGVGLGDYLVKEFGEYDPQRHLFGKIELCTFTNPLKVELFSKLRMAFEGRRLRVPVERAIREDLHSVHRVTSTAGNVTYRAPHTDDGHADRCTALALAIRAGQFNTGLTTENVRGIRIGGSRLPARQFKPRRLVVA